MKRIAVLGGTFNPVHLEHVELCKNAIAELNLDKLLVMPTYISPHNTSAPAPTIDRLEMLKRAFSGVEKVEISDYEILKEGKSYTYQTVEHFAENKDAKLFFIMGGDMLTDFKSWRYPERIVNSCTLAVFERENTFTDFKAEKEYFNKTFNKDGTKKITTAITTLFINLDCAFFILLSSPEKIALPKSKLPNTINNIGTKILTNFKINFNKSLILLSSILLQLNALSIKIILEPS